MISSTGQSTKFSTPAMKAAGQFVEIACWTTADFNKVGLEIFRRGYSPVSEDLIRSHIINEIFVLEEDESVAEEKAALLDDFWTAEKLYNEMVSQYILEEQQRRQDEAHGAPPIPDPRPPRHSVSPARKHRAIIIAAEVSQRSQKIRDLQAQVNAYNSVHTECVVRFAVLGWQGFQTVFVDEDGMMEEACFNAFRKEIGPGEYALLTAEILRVQELGVVEVGNSDLPASSESDQNSLPAPNGELGSSAGSSTASSTEQTPPEGSAPITDGSSTSTSGSTGETRSIDAGPSPAAGETNQPA